MSPSASLLKRFTSLLYLVYLRKIASSAPLPWKMQAKRHGNHEAESKVFEGESGVNWNAAPAANHCEARHSCITCRWSSPRVEGDSPAKGMGGGKEMAVRINFKGDDKRSGTG